MSCTEPPRTEQEPRRPNLLLISVDTLRADHLGCYGYGRETSPRLDALAAESIRFAAAFAPTPWTLPSHASMLSGMHPYEIGFYDQWRTLPAEIPLLAELLSRAGYSTAAFVDSQESGFVGAGRGFGRGFDHYQHKPPATDGSRFDVAATVDAGMTWLDRRDEERPFFLFLHTKSVHAVPAGQECADSRCFPYDKPEPYRFRFVTSEEASFSWSTPEDGSGQAYLWSLNARFLEGKLNPRTYPKERLDVLVALYDAGIYYTDTQLGRLLDGLGERGLLDDTVIVVTSDHGEAFLEHSLLMHQEVYDTLLRVPLLVRLPSSSPRGRVAEQQVTLADISPTLLNLAGIDVPTSMTGRSLPLSEAAIQRPVEARELFAYYLFPGQFEYQGFALRRGDLKIVLHNIEPDAGLRPELYDTALDPMEQRPLVAPERVAEMRRALARHLRMEPVALGVALRKVEAPASDIIRSLGYVE